MSRQVQARTEAFDQFSVWADEITKVPGLTPDDFSVSITLDTVLVEDVEVVVEEIDGLPGDYRIRFTPPTGGFWYVEVTYAAGRQVYDEDFDVFEPVVVGSGWPPGVG